MKMNKTNAAYENMHLDPTHQPWCPHCQRKRMNRVNFFVATCSSCGQVHNIKGFVPLNLQKPVVQDIDEFENKNVRILPKSRVLTPMNKKLIRRIWCEHWEFMDESELADAFGVSVKTIIRIVQYKDGP